MRYCTLNSIIGIVFVLDPPSPVTVEGLTVPLTLDCIVVPHNVMTYNLLPSSFQDRPANQGVRLSLLESLQGELEELALLVKKEVKLNVVTSVSVEISYGVLRLYS